MWILPTPNIAAVTFAQVGIIALVWLGGLRHGMRWLWFQRILAGLGLLLALAAIAATGSRAGTLAFTLAAVVVALFRAVPPTWCVLAVLGLIGAIILAPSADRFVITQPDGSINGRLATWRATLALIGDHPWSGVGQEGIRTVLDCWYLAERQRRHLVTALNEVLTCAMYWGIPLAAVALGCVATLAAIGIRAAQNGSRVALVGLGLLTIQLVASQFQAHVFMPWWWGRISWLACIAVVLLGSWGPLRGMARRALVVFLATAVLGGGVLLLLSAMVGDAPWKTVRTPEGPLLAVPRHVRSEGTVLAIGKLGAAERDGLLPWLDQTARGRFAVILTPDVPRRAWWETLTAPGPRLVVADGREAVQLWAAWRDGRIGPGYAVVLTDPATVPAEAPLAPEGRRGPLRVLMGKASPQRLMRYEVEERLARDGCPPATWVGSMQATWYVRWDPAWMPREGQP